MNTAPALPITINEQDYLQGEKLSTERHEYIDGQLYLMAGASKHHSEIAVNLTTALRVGSRKTACKVYASDMKVRVVVRKTYYYPDVVVSCEPDEADDYYLENPCLIIEVLSDSTAKRDRSEKLLAYMNIPTLQTYLLVEQDKVEVEMFYKDAEGHWWVNTFNDLTAVLQLSCPNLSISLADIYEGIEFAR